MIGRVSRRVALCALAGMIQACGRGFAPLPEAVRTPIVVSALPAIRFPADELPHANLTEWWYFTGHLKDAAGERHGFEFVIFQAVRGGAPPGYAAHFAVTDPFRSQFSYAQRTSLSDGSNRGAGLDLCVGGWTLRRTPQAFAIRASIEGYELDLILTPSKPPALHNRSGKLDFTPFGWSYYYSHTRLSVAGRLVSAGVPDSVEGLAWMDHQWGDFISIGSGGWDWFSLQLDDGRDFTASIVRDETSATVLKYGTLVDRTGSYIHLDGREFDFSPMGSWTSPRTQATYPSGWHLTVPVAGVDVDVIPLLPDQELDTRASTGAIYWEGAVEARSAGKVVGAGYVELTGYARGGKVEPTEASARVNLCR